MEDLTTTLLSVLFALAVIAGTVTVMALVMKFFDDSLSDR
jgi:Flp pilus assembly pilin Flp